VSKRRAALEELKAQLARPASLIELGDRGPAVPGALASWFGRVNVALPGEEWPEDDGRPMVPIAQFNLSEAPYVPPALADVALIAVYFGQSSDPPDSAANGDGWLLRAYPALDDLQMIDAPPEALAGIWSLSGSDKPITARPIRYKLLAADYPDYEDLPADVDEELSDAWSDSVGASAGSKLGGWPSLIQGEISWAPMNEHPANPEFVFQLGAMAKTNFFMPDDGMCYFGRGTGPSRNVWTFEWQIA
jgi:Domain of unknown function (DUF1963)